MSSRLKETSEELGASWWTSTATVFTPATSPVTGRSASTQALSADCVACHQEPPVHTGDFGTNCQYCHDAGGWSRARLRIHVFPLDRASEADLACQTCHTTDYTAYTCEGCHEHEAEPTRPDHVATGLSAADLSECASCHPSDLATGSGR